MATNSSPSSNAETTLEATGESPTDIASLLKSLGLSPKSTMEQFSEAVSKSGGLPTSSGGGQGAIGDIISGLAKHVGDPIKEAVTAPLGQSLTAGFSGTEDPSAPAPAKKAAPKLADPTKAAAPVTAQSPYEELANALASSYMQQVNQLEPLISGQGIFGPGGQTAQAVQAGAAMAPGAGGWLGQQAAAEGKAAAPLQAAMGQVGNAEAAGALGTAQAIGNTGLANTEYLASAPYQQILQELANETAYKAASGTGAAAFGATPQNTPAFLSQIFSNLGLGGAGITAGGPTVPGAKTSAANKSTSSTTSGTGNPSGP